MRRSIRIAAAVVVALVAAVTAVRLSARWVPLPADFLTTGSTVVTFRDGSFAHVFLSPDDKWRIAVDIDDVDPRYLQALLHLEDRNFYRHRGVDYAAVLRALVTNVREGRVVSGASTITMQLVRVREPRPRTLVSKGIEAYRAWQVEAQYDKRTILELYLTYVPYGRNVEGIEAASLAYFGHRPSKLGPDEVATLLAVPQNPNVRFPSRSHQGRLRRARDAIAQRLGSRLAPERQDDETLVAEVQRAPVVARIRPFPRHALHASYWLADRDAGDRVRTTLDRGTQKITESILREAGRGLEPLGINNGAAVVVDHDSGEVLGLVGNFDFWDRAHGGQIAGFARPRSPGSALKPFLYALAVDRGRVLPEHLVPDVPRRYGTYAPKNYDGRYDGLVRLEDALARSLNVPFVDVLADVGVDPFIGHLTAWGVESVVDQEGHYGLSAAIGGLEISPLELAALYAMLAKGGRYQPLRIRSDALTSTPQAMFAPGTAFLTQRALRIRDRPDFPSRRKWSGIPPQVHWKTGTSYGHRDAWAAGSDERHTVVVWLGNFDNTPSRHLVGGETAGPILFDILEALATGRPPADLPEPPGDLIQVEVCRFSGHRPTRACPHRRLAWALASRVPTEPCPYHRAVEVDRATGLAVRPQCRGERAYETRSFLRLPSSVRRWMSAHRRDLPAPPAWAEGCRPQRLTDVAPRITSPAPYQTALLLPGVDPSRQEIPLEAESAARQLSWFMDGRFLGTVSADRPVWWPPSPGRHEVVVVDEAGLSSRRAFRVGGRLRARD